MFEIRAHYLIETPLPVEQAAAAIAGEQSTGTFMKLASETVAVTARAGARVARIERLAEVPVPSLPGARASSRARYTQARIEIVWPYANIGPDLQTLMATISRHSPARLLRRRHRAGHASPRKSLPRHRHATSDAGEPWLLAG